ncbi:MAG TPA: Xaa-Pro peptidase family protein [Candidatus Limnocylindria bacterium]|nr:Xaa-Pro peptidase family protein [Candidatus Limnocylindria bacterium]
MSASGFSREELRVRVARLQGALAERDLDAAVVTRPHNVYYLTGYRSMGAGLAAGMGQLHAVLVPRSGEPTLFIRSLETKVAQRYAAVETLPYRDFQDAYALVAERMPADARRIGVERLDITAAQLDRLTAALPATELSDISLVVDALRRVKSPQELAYMREAARLANIGLEAAIEAVRPGVRISRVVAAALAAMYEAGQDDVSSPPVLVWSGPDGGMMHDTALGGAVADGDLVTIEVIGSSRLYSADAMGTIAAGSPSAELRDAYRLAVALHEASQEAVRAGATGDAVHAAADAVFRDGGHGSYNRRVGGAVGINAQPSLFFEGLNLLRGEEAQLEAGMTVLVQPGVDVPAMMIVASTNAVTADGHEELTRPLRELICR